MSKKQRGLLAVFIIILSTVMVSACTQSLSSAPVATPTLIPPELFVSPLPSVENPMQLIEEFAKQTAVAQTSVANGGTPGTPQAIMEGTAATPEGIVTTATPTAGTPGTPTNAVSTTTTPGVVVSTSSGPATTPVPAGVRPASYTLQNGEYPYCIARRFNVDPNALLTASGISSLDLYYPGLTLTIPQSGSFPGTRMLATHPITYTVASSAETVFSIACKFGDLDPATIASANNIASSAKLTTGQQLQIP
jgi:LysM repeat protein